VTARSKSVDVGRARSQVHFRRRGEREEMLRRWGVSSVEELFRIPPLSARPSPPVACLSGRS